ncbi:MAG: LuxR C-terminal-related transcriptional regulator [Actinocatenispora sp.]
MSISQLAVDRVDDPVVRPAVRPYLAPVKRGSAVRDREPSKAFMSLLDRSGIGLAVLDSRLRVIETNAVFSQQFGRFTPGAVDRNFCELLHPSVRQHLWRQFTRLAQGHTQLVERVTALWADEPSSAGELTGIALDGDAGQPRNIMVLVKPDRSAGVGGRTLVGPTKMLTDLDARILEGVATGMTTVQLAAKLYLSRQGVEYHISTMLRKFKVPNRAALASKAYSVGIFRVGCWPPQVLPDYVTR